MDTRYAIIEVETRGGVLHEAFSTRQKGCGFILAYPVINVKETGRQLKRSCERRNVTVRQIQEFLGLAALQSIYGWFQGRALPTLDNFYALSCYLGVRMEDLVVPEGRSREVPAWDATRALERRQMAYYAFCLQAEAAGCAV